MARSATEIDDYSSTAENVGTQSQPVDIAAAVVVAGTSSDPSAEEGGRVEAPVEANSPVEDEVDPFTTGASTGPSAPDAKQTSGGVCLSVPLGNQRLLNSSGGRVGRAVEVRLPDGQFEVTLVSADELHTSGSQVSQAEEQWVLEFLDAAGAVVAETRPIGDLGDADLELVESVGSYDMAGVVAVRPRHLGVGGVNSVVASRVVFSNTACPAAADPPNNDGDPSGGVCLSVPLGNQRLLNSSGGRVGRAVEVRLPDGQFEVTLVSADELHTSGSQVSQAEEQWVLEFLDAAGAVVAETRPIGDLGDADLELVESVGSYDMAGVVAVRPRHLGVGGVNSVVASRVVFSNTACPAAADPPNNDGDPSGGGSEPGLEDGDSLGSGGQGDPSDPDGSSDQDGPGTPPTVGDLFEGVYEAEVVVADSWEQVGPGIEVYIPAALNAVPAKITVDFDPPAGEGVRAPGRPLIDPFSIEIDGLSGALEELVAMRFTADGLQGYAQDPGEVVRISRYEPLADDWVLTSGFLDSEPGQLTMLLDHLSVFSWFQEAIADGIEAGDDVAAFFGIIAERPECGATDALAGEFEVVGDLLAPDVLGCVERGFAPDGSPAVTIKIANRAERTIGVKRIPGFVAVNDAFPTFLSSLSDDYWLATPGSSLTLTYTDNQLDQVAGIGPTPGVVPSELELSELHGELALSHPVVVSYPAEAVALDILLGVVIETVSTLLGLKKADSLDWDVVLTLLATTIKRQIVCISGLINQARRGVSLVPLAGEIAGCIEGKALAELTYQILRSLGFDIRRVVVTRVLLLLVIASTIAKVVATLISAGVGAATDDEDYRATWPARFPVADGSQPLSGARIQQLAGFAVSYSPIMYVSVPGPFTGLCPDEAPIASGWCQVGPIDVTIEDFGERAQLLLRPPGVGADRTECLETLVILRDQYGAFPSAAESGPDPDLDRSACSEEGDGDDGDDPPGSDSGPVAKSFGDPHQLTFDSLRYSFQAEGEFVLVESTEDDLEIQARHVFTGTRARSVSLVSELAVRTPAGQVVLITNDVITLDGVVVDGTTSLTGGEIVDGAIQLDDGTTVVTSERGLFMDVRITLASGRATEVVGTLGNANNDPDDDLQVRGEATTVDPFTLRDVDGRAQLYDVFGPSWVPTAAERLLSGPATPYVAPSPVRIADFDDVLRAEAIQICEANGWMESNGLAECVFDLLLTGDPASADPSGQFDLPDQVVDAANAADLSGVGVELLPNPNQVTTSTGDVLAVEITDPETGATIRGPDLMVSGLAGVGGTTSDASVVYVIDVSGSTARTGGDCNGDGVVDAGDDFNPDGDSRFGLIIDCEIAGLLALNESLATTAADVDASLVLLGSAGLAADVDPADGVQTVTGPGTDQDGNGTPDVADVLASTRTSGADLFTRRSAGPGTSFESGLQAVGDLLMDRPAGQPAFVYFLSDGGDNSSAALTVSIDALAADGVVINTYSVGAGAAGCVATSTLLEISDGTSGTCTVVADPSELTAELTRSAAGLATVLLNPNDGTPIEAVVNPFGQWQAPLTGVPIGRSIVRATATAADGTTASSEIVIYRLE